MSRPVHSKILPIRYTTYTNCVTFTPPPVRPQGRLVDPQDLTCKVKVKAFEFDGRFDQGIFLDWLVAMEDNFEWYNMDDSQRI